jgi:hypothetical protein
VRAIASPTHGGIPIERETAAHRGCRGKWVRQNNGNQSHRRSHWRAPRGGAGGGHLLSRLCAPAAHRTRRINYDHPDAIETALLLAHLRALQAGETIQRPIYDFTTYSRRAETIPVEPRPVLILEGILILVDEALRQLLDIKVFVDADADLRFIRRLTRDVRERAPSIRSSPNTWRPCARCIWRSSSHLSATQTSSSPKAGRTAWPSICCAQPFCMRCGITRPRPIAGRSPLLQLIHCSGTPLPLSTLIAGRPCANVAFRG